MIKRRADNNYCLFDNIKKLGGSITARSFFDNVCSNTIVYLERYFVNMPKEYKEHGFKNSEQQIKSYLTAAINKVTNSSFMQEVSVDRKSGKSGRVDYWANFQNCSFLIEVKHNWIHYYPETNKITWHLSKSATLKSAVQQLDDIDERTEYKYRNHLYSLGMLVAPFYVRNRKAVPLRFDEDLANNIIFEEKKNSANIFALWILDKKYLYLNEWEENSGKESAEYYPAMCFSGKFKKLSK